MCFKTSRNLLITLNYIHPSNSILELHFCYLTLILFLHNSSENVLCLWTRIRRFTARLGGSELIFPTYRAILIFALLLMHTLLSNYGFLQLNLIFARYGSLWTKYPHLVKVRHFIDWYSLLHAFFMYILIALSKVNSDLPNPFACTFMFLR